MGRGKRPHQPRYLQPWVEKIPNGEESEGGGDSREFLVRGVGSEPLVTVVTNCEKRVAEWIGELRFGDPWPPRVVGIAFHGSHGGRDEVRAISICHGGNSVLIFRMVPGHGFSIKKSVNRKLREFFGNREMNFVGFGVEKMASKLRLELGYEIRQPKEARVAAAECFYKEQIEKYEKKRKGPSELRLAMMDYSRDEVVKTVLLHKVELRKTPNRVVHWDWSSCATADNKEVIMHAAIDAYFSFKIGTQ